MRVDVSFLPALAAAFMLVFARIGTMLMLLPGLGELMVSARLRLATALLFATNLHHLVIAALDDSYTLFHPGEVPLTGDMAALMTRTVAGAFRVGVQISAPFLVFGLLFNLGLGLLSRLMPQMQVFFVGIPLSIIAGFLILVLVLGALMGIFLGSVENVLGPLTPPP